MVKRVIGAHARVHVLRRLKLRSISPAPTSNTSDSATSAATSTSRNRACERPVLTERPFRLSTMSDRDP